MKRISIHNYERKHETMLKNLHGSEHISEKNKQIIIRFNDACLLNGMSKPRILRYLYFFSFLFKFFNKDLDSVTKEDVESIVTVINTRESFSPVTKHDCKVMLKRFYKWLFGHDEEYPPEVKWIKSSIKRHEKRLPGEGEMITPEDVTRLIEASEYSRDKAFVSLLYESGCRVGEIGSMTIGSVGFDKYGTVMTVSGKTGSRKMRVVSSTPYLRNWLNSHPFKNDKDMPLWINFGARNHNKSMDYHAFKMVLTRLFKKAGINKRHNPHLFRHSRATYMANHLTEFQMNQYFGWIQGSDMPATYVHLSGRETDKAILEMNGLQQKKTEKEEVKVKVCPRCDSINDVNDIYCSKCSFVLDEKEALKLETEKKEEDQMTGLSKKILVRLLQRPEIIEILNEEVKNLKE